jgi:excisionase family DNA binding protein
MDIDADIRRIARDEAREVFREELARLERTVQATRTPERLAEPLLTVDEVAKLCNVGTKTVQRWIGKGLLRAVRSPGMRDYRIPRRAYEALASGAPAGAEGPSAAPEEELEAQVTRAVAAAAAPPRDRR